VLRCWAAIGGWRRAGDNSGESNDDGEGDDVMRPKCKRERDA
jgi:hypothetical protein